MWCLVLFPLSARLLIDRTIISPFRCLENCVLYTPNSRVKMESRTSLGLELGNETGLKLVSSGEERPTALSHSFQKKGAAVREGERKPTPSKSNQQIKFTLSTFLLCRAPLHAGHAKGLFILFFPPTHPVKYDLRRLSENESGHSSDSPRSEVDELDGFPRSTCCEEPIR